jgi:hypothetical protein
MHPHHNTPPQNGHAAGGAKRSSKTLVADQNYDRIERYTLETARIFFVAFTDPQTQFWMHAYRYCESAYAAPNGATIAQATLNMLNAMRTTRPHTFNFTDPRCRNCSEYMTAEERYLMETFRHLRHNRYGPAHMNALLLCEGNDPTEFLDAIVQLIQLVPRLIDSKTADLPTNTNYHTH